MASQAPQAPQPKRQRVKWDPQPPQIQKFQVGDMVYVNYVPDLFRHSLFSVKEVKREVSCGGEGWSYVVENDSFLGKDGVMVIPEHRVFKNDHQVGAQFEYTIVGTKCNTTAIGTIGDWRFQNGRVVYDIHFNGPVEKVDLLSKAVSIGNLGAVVAQDVYARVIRASRDANWAIVPAEVVTTYDSVTAKATVDTLGRPL